MLKKSRDRIVVVYAAAIVLTLSSTGSAIAETVNPTDVSTNYRYLPPTAGFLNGLDTTSNVFHPPPLTPSLREKDQKLDKSNHLPVKPVKGGKVTTQNYELNSMDNP